jgi:hypothetical protein
LVEASVDLSYNHITEIEIGALSQSIVDLHLNNNALTRLHPDSLPASLSRLSVPPCKKKKREKEMGIKKEEG